MYHLDATMLIEQASRARQGIGAILRQKEPEDV